MENICHFNTLIMSSNFEFSNPFTFTYLNCMELLCKKSNYYYLYFEFFLFSDNFEDLVSTIFLSYVYKAINFHMISGTKFYSRINFFRYLEFELWPPEKSRKIRISKIAAIRYCMQLQTKFQLQRTCRVLEPSLFMWNLAIFSTMCIFSYIW